MKTLAVGIVAIGAAGAWGGCSTTNPTELVPAVMSQVQVPRNLQAVTIEAQSNGAQVFCRGYQVFDGKVELPATLGFGPQNENATVTITVRGYDTLGATGASWSNCQEDAVSTTRGTGGPRVLRRSVQTYTPGHEIFVPMPLSYSCFETDCSGAGVNATCKGAQCVDGLVDGGLVDFNPQLVTGDDQPCFSPKLCFADAVPAVPVAGQPCTYKFIEGTPPGTGVNVRVFYQDLELVQDPVAPSPATAWHPVLVGAGEEEILSDDAVEGFTVLPGQQFQLPQGLCALAGMASNPPVPTGDGGTGPVPYRAITDIQVASACAPKNPLTPICASEKSALASTNLPAGTFTADGLCNVPRKLLPSPTALYLAVDDTTYMQVSATQPDGGPPTLQAFGPKGEATLLAAFLSNPVFSRTYLAFQTLTHQPSDCMPLDGGTKYEMPSTDFGLAGAVAGGIQSTLSGLTMPTSSGPLVLAAVLGSSGTYERLISAAMAQRGAYNTQAVLLFVNRVPGGTYDPMECAPPAGVPDVATEIEAQVAAAATSGIQTFFIVLNTDPTKNDPAPAVVSAYQTIAAAAAKLGPNLPPVVIDATNESVSLGHFASALEPMTTCLYDLPQPAAGSAAIDWTTAQLKYTNPVALTDTAIPNVADCKAAGAAGWSVETAQVNPTTTIQRARVCGHYCSDIQNMIIQASVLVFSQDGITDQNGMLLNVPPSKSIPWLDVPISITPPCAGAGDAGAGDGG
jgi:hypothetical protein